MERFSAARRQDRARGGNAVLDKEIHFLDLFRLDEFFGMKIRHLSRDARSERINIRKSVDLADTGPPGDECLPVFFDASAQWRHQPQACDHNSALVARYH
jgi:hypothetical protein